MHLRCDCLPLNGICFAGAKTLSNLLRMSGGLDGDDNLMSAHDVTATSPITPSADMRAAWMVQLGTAVTAWLNALPKVSYRLV